jgi:ketosteroid isomerase-like protein
MTNKEIVSNFIKAINDHNVEQIYELMSDDHTFIDGYGERYVGRKDMKEGWTNYYKLFPDYYIEITDITENETIIGLFGYAGGTYKNIKDKSNSNYWRTPASWKAIVENREIKLWQVFCDYSKLLAIIDKNQNE